MDKKELIKSAYLALKQDQLAKALEYYQKLHQLDQSDTGVLCLIGDCFVKQGNLFEALKQYRRALLLSKKQQNDQKADVIQKKMNRIDPDSVADFEMEFAASTDKIGEETAEISALKQAVEKNPKNPELLEKAGKLFEKQKLYSDSAKYFLALGNVLYGSKQFDKAIELFQHILGFKPNYIQAHIALAETYSKQGSDSDAKKEYLYAAEQLIRNGDFERGQMFAQKAIQLKSIEAHYYLGLIHLQNNNKDDTKKEIETLMKFKVNHQGGLTLLALLYCQNNQLAEANVFYERLLKVDPKNAEAMEAWADSLHKQGDTALAIEKISQAIDTFAAQEQWERAAVCATKAIEFESDNQEFYLKLAEVFYNAGLEEQAAETCMTLASLLESKGLTQEAEQMRAKAQEITDGSSSVTKPQPVVVPTEKSEKVESPPLSPSQESQPKNTAPPKNLNEQGSKKNLQMMMNIADTYIQQGSLDEAIEIYQEILKSEPRNDKVKSALTRVYAMFAGINPETAVARRTKSETLEKDEHQVQREARERAQREAQVRSQRKAVTESSPIPKNESSGEGLLTNMGNEQEDEIAGDNQDEFMTVTVAEIYTKQGLLNEALKIYQKILEIEPGNQEALLKKKELETKMLEQEKLRQQSEKVVAEKAAAEKAAAEKAAAEKAAAEKAAADKAAADKAAEIKSSTIKKSKKDGQDPPPPKRQGRVSYV